MFEQWSRKNSHPSRPGKRRCALRQIEQLEPRLVLATDFGDAPDTGAGTGAGNYETLLANGGPSHTIVAGLFLGARVDGESNGSPNVKANGDDIGTDDEDGVVNPEADLRVTAGTQPTIALRATNTTGTAATLSGWIDSNGNGVFDNATERAQIAVPAGTNNGRFTLTLPTIPAGFFGTTYARFRLSTDAGGQNATGAASDGEVEDYAFTISVPGESMVKPGGATTLGTNGIVARVGDLDGDGVTDVALGQPRADGGGIKRGTVDVLLLNADGTTKSTVHLASGTNGAPTLDDNSYFGSSLESLGDFDGDGVVDLAVGSDRDSTGSNSTGAVHILLMNANGTVKSSSKIANETNGGPGLVFGERFGSSIANMGDLDGDGIVDLAVGGRGFSFYQGNVHILFLNSAGGVKASQRIGSGFNGGPVLPAGFNLFGVSVENLGDLDGDGVADLAVGAENDSSAGNFRGALHVLFLNSNGTVKSFTKIASGVNGGPGLTDEAWFGSSVANLGDLNGDGVIDLAVGKASPYGGNTPSLFTLLMNSDGTAKSSVPLIGSTMGANPGNGIGFGKSVVNLGDIDGDGIVDLGASPNFIFRLFKNITPADVALSSTALNALPVNIPSGTAVGKFSTVDINIGNTFTYTLVSGTGSTDNATFTIVGDQLRTNAAVAEQAYSIRVRTTDQGGLFFEEAFTITVSASNTASPVLDSSGNPFAVLGVGGRQSVEMRQGTLVSEILARGAGGDPISDADPGAQDGIAVTAFDASLGTFQYTLVTNSPQESDWKNIDADGAVSESSALLLPATARLRFVTALVPHHLSGAGYLPLESKLDTGLTFRAWDLTSGSLGGRGDTSANGGATAFSTTTETARVYFEARLWRSFNTNAQLNVYTLEAEFTALTANPAYADRSTSAYTGFTILMSAVPELSTAPLFRMYFGVQFNDDGTETDMGYRYLTPETGEAGILEGLGKPEKQATREGAYFRELGVNNGTAVLGYIYTTQQPGTSEMTQIYRTDAFDKPTRPGGTAEGSTPTSTKSQEQGDHVYTTNTVFETGRPGTWRVERVRGFVRELSPNPTGGPPPAASVAAVSAPAMSAVSAVADVVPTFRESVVPVSPVESVARLVATPVSNAQSGTDDGGGSSVDTDIDLLPYGEASTADAGEENAFDVFFTDPELVGAAGWGI